MSFTEDKLSQTTGDLPLTAFGEGTEGNKAADLHFKFLLSTMDQGLVRPLGRSTETSCESKTLQAQLNAIAAPIRKAFIFNQLLLSFCRYFAKIADATGAMSLSLVKSQVKIILSAACPQGPCAEAPFCVTMTVAIEFHSLALIRAHVRSRRHFARLPHQNSRVHVVQVRQQLISELGARGYSW